MFTGIIEAVGIVRNTVDGPGGRTLRIAAPFASALSCGQSIAINGACLTATEVQEDCFSVTAVTHTLRVTNLDVLRTGSKVNLERAMPAQGRFEGHIVQGHVDATCRILQVNRQDRRYTFSLPTHLRPYVIARGSIALDGISLTVATKGDDRFTVVLIPYTYAHTTSSLWETGSLVNLECDVLGKYALQHKAKR